MNKLMLFALLMVSCAPSAHAEQIVSVYDGDTVRFDADCNDKLFCKNLPLRIKYIDTPEIRTKCKSEKVAGYAAKRYLIQLLENADTVEIIDKERGKYFRVLGVILVDGKSVAYKMVKSGHAVPYFGGKRERVCND